MSDIARSLERAGYLGDLSDAVQKYVAKKRYEESLKNMASGFQEATQGIGYKRPNEATAVLPGLAPQANAPQLPQIQGAVSPTTFSGAEQYRLGQEPPITPSAGIPGIPEDISAQRPQPQQPNVIAQMDAVGK